MFAHRFRYLTWTCVAVLTSFASRAYVYRRLAGAGVAVLSRLVVARALKAGDLVELALELPDRAFHALRHKERYRTRAADALTDLIKEQVA